MKRTIIILLAIVSFAFKTNAQDAHIKNTLVLMNLSSERFKAVAFSDKNGMILDLRTTEEIIDKGYIKGAVQLDYLAKDAEAKISKLDKNKTYYIYCASGGRSRDAADYMESKGFKKVYNLEKGFSEWISKGLPVEKK